LATNDQRTPFAVVTTFVPTITAELPRDSSREQVIDAIGDVVKSENYLYAVRITGEFDWIRTRTAARQARPYPPLREATRGEPVIQFDDIAGTVSGFRTPLYEQGIGVPGGHVHFLDERRERGGHVLDYRLRGGSLEVCIGTDLHLSLPLTAEFGHAQLTPDDLAEQVRQTENHR
jgi:acetolactate decarboxylase